MSTGSDGIIGNNSDGTGLFLWLRVSNRGRHDRDTPVKSVFHNM